MELGIYQSIEGHTYVPKTLVNHQRFHHTHVIGKTGMGKSTALKNWAIDDMQSGEGLAFFDLHGHDIDDLLRFIPSSRARDVALIDFSDREYPVAFNPLESVPLAERPFVTETIVDAFRSIWNHSWGPQLEDFLRYGTRALLDNNESLIGLKYLLIKPGYRESLLSRIEDPVVRDYWRYEFTELMSKRDQQEKTLSLRNKIGLLISDPGIRNVIGQRRSTIRIAEIMQEGKILLIKLPQGSLGLEKARILALLLLSSMHLAALQRSNGDSAFHLFLDEAHHFQGNTLTEMLSGIRKFNVSLTLAHQYLEQFEKPMQASLMGTVGTLVAFQTGLHDSRLIQNHFDDIPVKSLHKMPKGYACVFSNESFYVSLAHSAYTQSSRPEKIINRCRNDYALSRVAVEEKIHRFIRRLK